MLFFTTAVKEHQLEFKKLSDYEGHHGNKYLRLTASWAKKAWGYLHGNDKDFYIREINNKKDHIYLAMYANQPVAMFGLFEKQVDPFLDNEEERTTGYPDLKFVYLDYIYVDERFRGLGFARQIMNKSTSLAQSLGADLMYLDTLSPKLNNFYTKCGAMVICEGQYLDNPTDVLSIKFS